MSRYTPSSNTSFPDIFCSKNSKIALPHPNSQALIDLRYSDRVGPEAQGMSQKAYNVHAGSLCPRGYVSPSMGTKGVKGFLGYCLSVRPNQPMQDHKMGPQKDLWGACFQEICYFTQNSHLVVYRRRRIIVLKKIWGWNLGRDPEMRLQALSGIWPKGL